MDSGLLWDFFSRTLTIDVKDDIFSDFQSGRGALFLGRHKVQLMTLQASSESKQVFLITKELSIQLSLKTTIILHFGVNHCYPFLFLAKVLGKSSYCQKHFLNEKSHTSYVQCYAMATVS